MKNLSREAILRMVGLHDAANFNRLLNSIQLSIEEEKGQMVTYWTEIRKSEREVALIAGRMDAAETSIGQLQVTASQLTASVSSLTTTVNGHTTSIGQLQITANNLTASVSSISDTVNGHTTSIGQLEITSNSISNRVTVIEGDYVKEAEISLMVKKDSSGYISNALVKADIIDFTFTQSTNFNSGGQTVMNINSSGDLWILGNLKGGNIQGNYTIGSLGTKMEIYVDETVGATKCSGIRGHDSNNWEVIKLGMQEVGGNVIPSLRLNDPNAGQMYLYPSQINIENPISGVTSVFVIGWSNNKVNIWANVSNWPSSSNASVGQVYLDNGYLKVRTS